MRRALSRPGARRRPAPGWRLAPGGVPRGRERAPWSAPELERALSTNAAAAAADVAVVVAAAGAVAAAGVGMLLALALVLLLIYY